MHTLSDQDLKKDLEILYVFQFNKSNQKYDYFKSSLPSGSCHIELERLESSVLEYILNTPNDALPNTEIINIGTLNFEVNFYASENKIMGSIKDITDLLNKIAYYENQLQARDTIIEINHAIIDFDNTTELLNTILEKVIKLFNFPECGTILALNDGWLTIEASVGYDAEMCKSFKLKYKNSFQWHITQSGHKGPIIVNNLRQEMLNKGFDLLPTINGQELQSTLSVPLIIHNNLFGMINIDTTKNFYYNDYHLQFIQFIKEQVSLVIIKHLMYEEIRLLSEQDNLTKILNRTAFKNKFDAQCKINNDMHLINIDLNNFKDINDQFGHDAGDEVLIHFADKLQAHFGSNGLVGRIGGDEFAICTHDISEQLISQKINELLNSLSEKPLVYEGNHIPFHFSYGIASLKKDGKHFDELYKTADVRMYINKRINQANKDT